MDNEKTINILKQAILMEKRGHAFYTKVAEQTGDEEIRHIFTVMANEEVLHVKFLSEQFANFEKNHAFLQTELPEIQDAFSGMILSEDLKQKISAAGYEAAAISAAMDMETKAIEVYSKQAAASTDPQEKKLFAWLADWEKGHYAVLHELDKQLKEKIWNDNQFWPF